ncbi:hypothetical protein DFH94DRAFT_723176 [Russula ochroleuca]|uniref:Uncharacterized protein n=1 Tax=Russula ochroleuca TaxID=152965 RepID=A0A9P5N0Z9_9AGAM|nr:hypothetical protein DFH94DRAFT_723176 [Russula ochroleuca]
MSAAGYDLQGGQFDLSHEFEQEAPPYLPKAPPPTYSSTFRPCFPPLAMDPPSQHVPHDHHLPTSGGGLSPGAGPRDARLSGFDLAESIWSQNSDLTLDDLALSFDSTSSQSRSSMSSHWSAPPLTPSTSRHLDLQPPLEPVSLSVETQVQETEPEEPESPAPAYSRDALEFDPALLASLDTQLRLHPFEAFEDVCWASFYDSAPTEVPPSSQSQSSSLSCNLPSMSCTSLTADSAFSDSSTTIMFAPPMPYLSPPLSPPSPSQPPPAYPTSKPLPSLPPSSPIRLTAEHTQSSLSRNPQVVITFKSPIARIDNSPPVTPVETVQFFPLRPQARPRSKSGSGTKPVQRLTTAIARLRGRE